MFGNFLTKSGLWLHAIVFSLNVLLLSPAYGWGHLKTTSWGLDRTNLFLVNRILKDKKIFFAVENDVPNEFSSANLATEVRQAIQTWLSVVPERFWTGLEIIQVDNLDPRVQVRYLVTDNEQRLSRSFSIYKKGIFAKWKGEIYSDVSDMLGFATFETNDSQNYFFTLVYNTRLEDTHSLADFLPPGQSYSEFLEKISLREKLTTSQVSKMLGVHPEQQNSYMVVLHELGHAFGLADTYESTIGYMDPEFRSHPKKKEIWQVGKKGIMNYLPKGLRQYYPSQDDSRGVNRLFTRFIATAKRSTFGKNGKDLCLPALNP